jgi:tRNA 2-selenouridine synthase SelU
MKETESLVTLAALAQSLGVQDPYNTLKDENRMKERIILHLKGKEKRRKTVEVTIMQLAHSSVSKLNALCNA